MALGRLIDLAGVAAATGLPLRRVRWLAQVHILPTFKLGAKHYITEEDLQLWLAMQQNSQPPVPPAN